MVYEYEESNEELLETDHELMARDGEQALQFEQASELLACETMQNEVTGLALVDMNVSTATEKARKGVRIAKTDAAPQEPLTPQERQRYEQLKMSLRVNYAKGYAAAVAIGNELQEIKDAKYYRDDYGSWEAFLAQEFDGLTQNYASRHI